MRGSMETFNFDNATGAILQLVLLYRKISAKASLRFELKTAATPQMNIKIKPQFFPLLGERFI